MTGAQSMVVASSALGAACMASRAGARGGYGGRASGPILLANRGLDERTVIAPSADPGLGQSACSRACRSRQGEVIGELGGQLVEEPDLENPSAYLAGLPDCAFMISCRPIATSTARITAATSAAPTSRRGRSTGKRPNFQNAKIERVCRRALCGVRGDQGHRARRRRSGRATARTTATSGSCTCPRFGISSAAARASTAERRRFERRSSH